MPIYVYKFEDGQEFEVVQDINDDTLTAIIDSEGERRPVTKVYKPFFATYSGTGWARGH